MKQAELLQKLKGVHTVKTAMDVLGRDRQATIAAIHRLRTAGYVRTERARGGMRVYRIRTTKWYGASYARILSHNSPFALGEWDDYVVHGRQPCPEEIAAFAAASGNIRTITASVFLYRRIRDWKLLYRLAKERGIVRPVGALYDISRTVTRVPRMDGRIRNRMLPRPGVRYQDLVPGFRSRSFQAIEERWMVHLPLNRADLEVIA